MMQEQRAACDALLAEQPMVAVADRLAAAIAARYSAAAPLCCNHAAYGGRAVHSHRLAAPIAAAAAVVNADGSRDERRRSGSRDERRRSGSRGHGSRCRALGGGGGGIHGSGGVVQVGGGGGDGGAASDDGATGSRSPSFMASEAYDDAVCFRRPS